MEGLFAVFAYKNPVVRGVVDGIKFGFCRDLVKIVLDGYEYDYEKVDVVVPVPLHWYRENWRGFNQAEEIAKEIKGSKVRNILVRKRKTEQQARIKSKEIRVKNIAGAFEVAEKVRGMKVLLVDDVFTSGASMRECAKVLKKAGAMEVWGFVLAR